MPCCVCAAHLTCRVIFGQVCILSSFLNGFNTGVMNAPAAVVFPQHSTFLWSLAVSAFAVGGPFGAIAGGFMANRLGRRGACLWNMW